LLSSPTLRCIDFGESICLYTQHTSLTTIVFAACVSDNIANSVAVATGLSRRPKARWGLPSAIDRHQQQTSDQLTSAAGPLLRQMDSFVHGNRMFQMIVPKLLKIREGSRLAGRYWLVLDARKSLFLTGYWREPPVPGSTLKRGGVSGSGSFGPLYRRCEAAFLAMPQPAKSGASPDAREATQTGITRPVRSSLPEARRAPRWRGVAPPGNASARGDYPFDFRIGDEPSRADIHGADMPAIDQPADGEMAHPEKLRDFAYSS
jgi:hypothetical protein